MSKENYAIGAQGTARRFLALWLPFLPIDRLMMERPFARSDEAPLALIEQKSGTMRLTACNASALALGVTPGMTLADARARVPELAVDAVDFIADRRWLDRIAEACERFTPLVEAEPPDGLILDVTGCLHRFNGEAAMIQAVDFAMRHWASRLRLAMAGTPEGARALARFQSPRAGDEPAALRHLPIAALEMDEEVERTLRQAGFKTIGDLADRPSAPLAARFGAELIDRMDRVLGRVDSRITPHRKILALALEQQFAEPIATTDAVMAVIGTLAAEASIILEKRHRGGRSFVARLFRSDGRVLDLCVESSTPLRDAARIQHLFKERVDALADPIDPGFGFDMVRFIVRHDEPLLAAQIALEGSEVKAEAVAELIDRLSIRFGRQRVHRFVARDSHVPEQTSRTISVAELGHPTAWPEPEDDEPPLRPIHLFDPPQPIEVVTGLPDSPPQRFRWRRNLHEVVRAEGPERISAQWWRRAPGDQGLTRDYYRVEDVRGRRFWLFRHGLYNDEIADPCWYVHGLFA